MQDDTAMLRKLNQDFIDSVQRSDVRRFEQILADDFLNSNPDGSLVDRAGFLAQIARPAAIANLAAHDVLIRPVGDGRPSFTDARRTRRRTASRDRAATPTCGRVGRGAGCASPPTSRAAERPDRRDTGPPMSAVLLSLATFFSTLAGGLFALRFRDRLHFVLSFTAGVLLGVVSFDILPEIFALAREHALDPTGAMIALVAGFLAFHSLEKFLLVHHATRTTTQRTITRGWASPRRLPWPGTASWTAWRSASRSRSPMPWASWSPWP